MTQDVLAVGLGPGVWACGTKQAAWHDAACELQVIMHFVAVELCAKRILFVADASPAKPATAANANRTARHRIDCRSRASVTLDTIAR